MSDTEERWQGFDATGELNEQALTRDQAFSGALHGASHVWIWRLREGQVEILLQLRAATKSTWPNCWDISAAGHIAFGEAPLTAALRETKEEIGTVIAPENLALLFVFRAYMVADGPHKKIENEFQFVYGYQLADNLQAMLQTDEVDEVTWLSVDDFRSLVEGREVHGKKIVPHAPEYFANLLKEIARYTP